MQLCSITVPSSILLFSPFLLPLSFSLVLSNPVKTGRTEEEEEEEEEEMAAGRGKVAIPSFFKVFLPDVSSHRLPIPSAFSCYMKGKLPERGFLRQNRNIWPVGLRNVDDQFFFDDGWEKFVEDHHIELGEMLFFQFDGRNFFDFKLLSLNGCEKQIASPFYFNIKQEEEEEEDGESIEEEDEQEEDHDVEEEDDDKNDYNDDFHETEQQQEEEESDEESIEEEKKEEEEEDDQNDDDDCFHETGQEEEEEEAQGKAQKTGGSSRKRDMSSSIDDDAVFRSGNIARPKNPYFLVNFNRNRKEMVRRFQMQQIPGYVIKDFDMKLQSKITIQDDEGRSWLSNVVKWRDGRVLLTTGWRKFCRWNHLEKGNSLLCEFDPSLCFLRIQILEFDGKSWSPRPRNRG